jgi:hypothetical protein
MTTGLEGLGSLGVQHRSAAAGALALLARRR